MSGVEGGDGTVSGAEVESMDGDMTCERCDEHEAIACKRTKMRRTPRCGEVGEWVGRTRLRDGSTCARCALHDTHSTRCRPPSTTRVTARHRSRYRAIHRAGADEREWWRVGHGGARNGADAPAVLPTPARSSHAALPRLRSPHRSTAAPEIARRDVSVSDARGEVGGDDAIITTEEHAKRYAK